MNKLLDGSPYYQKSEESGVELFQALFMLTLGIGMIAGVIYSIATGFQYNTREVNASIPVEMTAEQFRSEYESLRSEAKQPYSTGEHYFDVYKRLQFLEVAADKLSGTVGTIDMIGEDGPKASASNPVPVDWVKMNINSLMRELANQRDSVKFDYEEFTAARTEFDAYRKANPLPEAVVASVLTIDFTKAMWFWIYWHVLGMVFAFANFTLQLYRTPVVLFAELFSGNLIGWTLGWQYYSFTRPNTNLKEQLENIRRSLAYAFGAFLSFCGYTVPAWAQSSTPTPAPAVKKSSTTITGDTEFNTQFLAPNGRVFSDKPYLKQAVTIEKGRCSVTFGISQTLAKPIGKLDGANMASVFAGCHEKFQGVDLSISGGYMNLDHLSNLKNDYVVVGVGAKLPTTTIKGVEVQPFANGEYFFATGKEKKPGFLATTGLSLKRKLGNKFSISANPRLTWDPGAFGNDRGVIAVINAKLERKFNNFTWRVVQLMGTIPLTRMTDGRKPAMMWGTGFSYQF